MSARTDAVLGLDIGTTTSKALVRPLAGGPGLVVEAPTPWRTTAATGTDIHPQALLALAVDLIAAAVRRAESAWETVVVRAVSVTGLAESGVLLDPAGRADVAAIAWFDRRGQRELDVIAERSPGLMSSFAGVTGLPWSFQASFAKLLWLNAQGLRTAGSSWLSVPEWIVHALGGDRLREPSLASRTGLIRQDTGEVWGEALDAAGLPAGLLPDAAPAGTPAGALTHDGVPAAAAGAVLSVAGHDHPVGALAVRAVGPDEVFNSTGTADVLARAVPSTLTDAQRAAIVGVGWSAGRHIVPRTDLLLAGGSGGLLLRRVLAALGVTESASRDQLDAASLLVTSLPPGLVVHGDGRTQDDVSIRFTDDASPAAIWAAATAYAAQLGAGMLADLEPVVGPAGRIVAAGGWTRMPSVRAAKTRALGRVEYRTVPQPGAAGAALVAEISLDPGRTLLDHPHTASQLADA